MDGFIHDNWHFLASLLFWVYVGLTSLQILLYALFLNQGWRKITHPYPISAQTAPQFPNLSVVICARNEAKNLSKVLPLLLEQQYPAHFEIIVVNDASTDETGFVLESFHQTHTHLRVIDVAVKTQAGKKAALSRGITEAKNPWLVLTDADCVPNSALWLQGMALQMLENEQIALVLGFAPTYAHAGWFHAWARFETCHTAFLYGGMAGKGFPYMGVGRNLAFKKSLFQALDGYQQHAHFTAGDDDLLVNAAANAQNTRVCTNSQTLMYSEGPSNWQQWLQQKKRHLSVSHAYQPLHQAFLSIFAGCQVMHYFLLFLNLLALQFALPALLLYGFRQLLWRFIYRRSFKTMESLDLLNRLPILDFMLALYFGLLVPYQLLFRPKNIAWK
jgi:glycosyltransferase involved in cell wall biosynthesis